MIRLSWVCVIVSGGCCVNLLGGDRCKAGLEICFWVGCAWGGVLDYLF